MADSFAKISSIIESARDITIEAAVSASTRLTETPTAKRPQEIAKLLSSRLDREVLNGMKCVMTLISSGEDGLMYFADVVKNVTLTNARVRALVMMYVEKYAESEPDTALLSINSVQKSLNDKAPNVRSASIRTLGGIRIPEIASLLLLCIKRTLSDRLPEVRSATALAIGSAFTIDGIDQLKLLGYLASLMADSSPLVVGTSVKVFVKLKPSFLKLLRTKTWAPVHANYRLYVRMLPDLEDWSWSLLTDLLVEYCRSFVPRPSLVLPDGSRMDVPEDFGAFPSEYQCEMDSDLERFVMGISSAAYSSSPLVVLSAVRALILVATPAHIIECGFPKILVKMMSESSSEPETLHILQLISKLTAYMPEAFQDYARKFFLHPHDSTAVASCKLHILLIIFHEEIAGLIIRELQFNATSYRREIAQSAVKAIGFCCQKSTDWIDLILQWCILEMENESASLILADLLKVVRFLLQQKQNLLLHNEQVTRTIYRLSLVLQNANIHLNEEAKSSIIWTIGEFTEVTQNVIGPDVLRQALKTYAQETEKVRYEILLLAAKSYLFEIQNMNVGPGVQETPSVLKKMFEYVMHLARYDISTCTRDKARMLDELFRDVSNHQLAYLFMQAPKAVPQIAGEIKSFALLTRYMKTPAWADVSTLPPTSIRKESGRSNLSLTSYKNDLRSGISNSAITDSAMVTTPIASAAGIRSNSNRLQSLDEFFGDEDESEESSINESDADRSSATELSASESESELDSDSESENLLIDQ
ncbi:ARM repeat-containing protein [Metschnikowia bicuspidata var. bicuspidata NRRL YB-4993]|uniref:ARM repeat-containing protein n=1 Tax=Metschnikowia bicuspidata var. bicuspidata NRRL YB-4993 TaxID=869754 RepID=A0A1A0H5X4_9ASCO|nr:ARM repeat-containing protein [Metschnikowia bicuspidata var. bicuspidata NRRL YB-4993]OBA19307.1 ARM repeat-containing protein [Metschnikowia bicuspidata var. bicuspidata NRRL YB-4993]